MSSKNDEEFLLVLLKAVNLACERQELLLEAMLIAPPLHEAEAYAHIEALSRFFVAAIKIIWDVQLKYGEASDSIAEAAQETFVDENGKLNLPKCN